MVRMIYIMHNSVGRLSEPWQIERENTREKGPTTDNYERELCIYVTTV